MKISKTSLMMILLAAGVADSFAQSTWDGGGGDNNWSTAANWAGDVVPTSATTTDIQLAGSTRLSPNVDSVFTIRTLTFNSGAGAFTLSGGEISMQGAGSADTAALNNNSTNTQTINNDIKLLGGLGVVPVNGDLVLNKINFNGFGARFNPGVGRTLTLNGVISGTAGTTAFNGAGTTIIKAANTFTAGTLYLWSGTVQVDVDSPLGSAGAFGSGASTVVQLGLTDSVKTTKLTTGAAVTIGQTVQLASVTSGTSSYTIGGDTAHTSNYNGTIFTGEVSKTSEALTVTAVSGGRVNIKNITQRSTATTDDDAVTKTGSGIVALTDVTNNYGGATTVSAGTLLINGTLTANSARGTSAGAVTVASGAVLGGTGTINRSVAVSAGGILAAGDIDASGVNQGGKLTLGAGLSLAGTSVLNFDLAASSSTSDDEVAITGNLTLDGLLNVTALSGFGAGSYRLFTYTGTLTDNGLSTNTLPGGYSYAIDTGTAGQVNLTVSAVPEPGSLVLVACGGLMLSLLRRFAGRQ